MKLPVSWLKEFVPVRWNTDELSRRLTFSGFEVEGSEDVQGETVFEVNVTPNRGDALSILGLAREVTALSGVAIKRKASKNLLSKKSNIKVSVKVSKKCPLYSWAVIRGVKVGESPEWLKKRLEQVGVRSINSVVDVTNYVLMECGQPLHAFDLQRLQGKGLTVRLAADKEVLETLDGTKRELQKDDLVITDDAGAVAVAGVMGGKGSEVTNATTDILLESAFFDPSSVRKTSRRLGLQTESSYRFERGVDRDGVLPALNRAVELILSVAGGVGEGAGVVKAPVSKPVKIVFSPARVSSLLGVEWPVNEIQKSLKSLGFGVKPKGKAWEVTVPSYRNDVSREEDLVEEVVRLGGLDRVPAKFPVLQRSPQTSDDSFTDEQKVRQFLLDSGFSETIHFSFLSPEEARPFVASEDDVLKLANPLGQEFSALRPSLIPSLLKVVSYHQRHKIPALRLFEMRNVFLKEGGKLKQRKKVAVAISGPGLASHWSAPIKTTDFFDLKGVAEGLLNLAGVGKGLFEKGNLRYLHPGKQAILTLQQGEAGILGLVHPDLVTPFDLQAPVFIGEFDLETLWSHRGETLYQSYSKQPIVDRDLALLVDENLLAGDILGFIRSQDGTIQDVSVFDLYRGDKLPQGKKSLAFSLKIGRMNQTMTDEEIQGVLGRVIDNVKSRFGAEVR